MESRQSKQSIGVTATRNATDDRIGVLRLRTLETYRMEDGWYADSKMWYKIRLTSSSAWTKMGNGTVDGDGIRDLPIIRV